MAKSSKCGAKNPANCRFHGKPVEPPMPVYKPLPVDMENYKPEFSKYVLEKKVASKSPEVVDAAFPEIADTLGKIPTSIDGKFAIAEMRDAGSTQWRQAEWPGFYFEEKLVGSMVNDKDGVLAGPGPQYGNSVIDGWIVKDGEKKPVDIKVHSLTDQNGKVTSTVLLNDAVSIDSCIKEHGAYYVLSVDCSMAFDDNAQTFKKWREDFQGGALKASKANASNPNKKSRVRKTALKVRSYSLYEITDENKHLLGDFKQGVQHSGAARNLKYSMNTSQLKPVAVFSPKL